MYVFPVHIWVEIVPKKNIQRHRWAVLTKHWAFPVIIIPFFHVHMFMISRHLYTLNSCYKSFTTFDDAYIILLFENLIVYDNKMHVYYTYISGTSIQFISQSANDTKRQHHIGKQHLCHIGSYHCSLPGGQIAINQKVFHTWSKVTHPLD